MMASSGRPEHVAHHVQSFSNSCQPACVAMALARRGVEKIADIEARLHVGAGPKGHPADERKWLNEPQTSLLKSTQDAADLRQLREALARGAWVMVQIYGPCWVGRLPRDISGPHGPLCAPAEAAKPLHAVLLVASAPAWFLVLDPFYSRDLQPLEVSDAEMLRVLSGFSSLVIEP